MILKSEASCVVFAAPTIAEVSVVASVAHTSELVDSVDAPAMVTVHVRAVVLVLCTHVTITCQNNETRDTYQTVSFPTCAVQEDAVDFSIDEADLALAREAVDFVVTRSHVARSMLALVDVN